MLGFIKLKIGLVNSFLAIVLCINISFGFYAIHRLNIEKELLAKEIKKQSINNTYNDFINRLHKISISDYFLKKNNFTQYLRKRPRILSKNELRNIIISKKFNHPDGLRSMFKSHSFTSPETIITFKNINRNGYEMLRDNHTGLIWKKKTSKAISYKEAETYIANLNKESYGGYSDWRIPSIEELLSILQSERETNGLYISNKFEFLAYEGYAWSIDLKLNTDFHWAVSYKIGHASSYNSIEPMLAVLAVRG